MRIVVAALMLTSVVLPAFADPRPPSAPTPPGDVTRMVTDDCARARKAGKTCVLEVQAEDVNGQTPTGDGVGTGVITFRPQTSLIHIRRDFIPEEW